MCDRAYRITGFGCTGEVFTNSRGEKGQCTVPQRLANCEKVRVCIIYGLTLVIKNSYTYCKILLALEAKYYYACPQGDRLVGKDHRSSPTATHKESNQRTPHASNLSHNGYHTCMLWDLQTSTQVSLQSTTTHQHDSNITIFISQNYCKESNISYSVIYKFYVGFYD